MVCAGGSTSQDGTPDFYTSSEQAGNVSLMKVGSFISDMHGRDVVAAFVVGDKDGKKSTRSGDEDEDAMVFESLPSTLSKFVMASPSDHISLSCGAGEEVGVAGFYSLISSVNGKEVGKVVNVEERVQYGAKMELNGSFSAALSSVLVEGSKDVVDPAVDDQVLNENDIDDEVEGAESAVAVLKQTSQPSTSNNVVTDPTIEQCRRLQLHFSITSQMQRGHIGRNEALQQTLFIK